MHQLSEVEKLKKSLFVDPVYHFRTSGNRAWNQPCQIIIIIAQQRLVDPLCRHRVYRNFSAQNSKIVALGEMLNIGGCASV